MKSEKPGAIVVFGEIGLVGVTADYLLTQPDHLNPISRISAKAGGIQAALYPNDEIHYVGCNPLGVGEEAEDMRVVTEQFYPETAGRIQTHNGLLDTSYQAEELARYFRSSDVNPHDIKVILPIEHTVRAWRQLRAQGVKPNIEMAHVIYTTDQSVDATERNRRRAEVADVYKNVDMYLNIMKEYWANVLGLFDPKGLVTRKLSQKVRGNN